jgi:hypothetical protein
MTGAGSGPAARLGPRAAEARRAVPPAADRTA